VRNEAAPINGMGESLDGEELDLSVALRYLH
jgi:hypothetical protein